MAKLLIWAIVLAAGFYLALAAALFIFQRRLLYRPDTVHHIPAASGLDGVEEVILRAPDGVKLIAWQLRPAAGQAVLLYFHGNGGGLSDRVDRIKRFEREGIGMFMPSYRGYAGSEGSPSEAAIIADAQLAYDHLIAKGIRPHEIVVYGESLGTGVAVQLAASRSVAAVILDAPYTSITDIAQQLYPFIPVRLFLKDKFASIEHIRNIRAPLLVLHGARDNTIPVAFGQALFAAAAEPKEMHVLDGAGHSDIYLHGAMPFLRQFLANHLRQPAELTKVSHGSSRG
jgi:fermentation-respiration switch protein FrsA (DUF1100 family)